MFWAGGEGRKLWRAPATPLWSVLVSTKFNSGNSSASSLLMACTTSTMPNDSPIHKPCIALLACRLCAKQIKLWS